MKTAFILALLFLEALTIPEWKLERTNGDRINLPIPKEGGNIIGLDGDLWAQNGYKPCVNVPGDFNIYEDAIFKQNTVTGTWTRFVAPGIRPPVRVFGVTYSQESSETVWTGFGGNIICGGIPIGIFGDFWKYSTVSNSWTNITATMINTPGPRLGPGFATVDDKFFYLFGGVTNTFSAPNDLWYYNVTGNTWVLEKAALANDTLQPHGRFNMGFVYNEHLDAFLLNNGDTLEGVPLSDLWIYYRSSKTWVNVLPAGQGLSDRTQFCR